MGEAKLKREKLRATLIGEMEKWTFPPSAWETQLVAELSALPSIRVERWPQRVLAEMGMPAKHCHENASWFEKNDPESKSRQVTGWWKQDMGYVLHSVVERDGEMACITPTPYHDDHLDFVPDPAIDWHEDKEKGVFVAYRNGVKIGPGVRFDSEGMIKHLRADIEAMKVAKNPYDVIMERRPTL